MELLVFIQISDNIKVIKNFKFTIIIKENIVIIVNTTITSIIIHITFIIINYFKSYCVKNYF